MARAATFRIAACVLVVGACSGKDPYAPGEPVGTFHVTAKLASSTCGQTPDPWEFDVRLRHDASTLYWVQGGAPVQGAVDASSHAVLTTRDVHVVRDADAKTKTPACIVTRADTLDVVLTAGGGAPVDLSSADAFAGSLTYGFAPDGQSDCTDQVGTTFATLPCDVRYDVTAARTRTDAR